MSLDPFSAMNMNMTIVYVCAAPEHNVENIWICSSGLVRSGRPVRFPVCGHVMIM